MSHSDEIEAWAARFVPPVEDPKTAKTLRVALYARVSTEDLQDPKASVDRQREEARRFLGDRGVIVVEYVDIGYSRSLPWSLRPDAQRFLLDAADVAGREFDALVVGEGKRAFSGRQFGDVAPRLSHYGVEVWVPDLGGKYNPNEPVHDTIMAMVGGMGASEREAIRVRVRGGMRQQVESEGRLQGGRPPYGYQAIGYLPHPNPDKARDGKMLKRLEIDPQTAPVVARVFADVIAGKSIRTIIGELNTEGVLCPSAYDPGRNSIRRGDGWQHSALTAILHNMKYTGRIVFGQLEKYDTLRNPENPSEGLKVGRRRSTEPSAVSDKVHDEIVSDEVFFEVQNILASRTLSRASTPRRKPKYRLQSLVRCATCERRMEVDNQSGRVRYRCRSKYLVGAAAAEHAKHINVQESLIMSKVSTWLLDLFSDARLEQTVDQLVSEKHQNNAASIAANQAEKMYSDAKKRHSNLLDAIEQGVPVSTLIDRIKQAEKDLAAAEAERTLVSRERSSARFSRSEMTTLCAKYSKNLEKVLGPEADPEKVNAFLQEIGLSIIYDQGSKTALAAVEMNGPPHPDESMRGTDRVRRGS